MQLHYKDSHVPRLCYQKNPSRLFWELIKQSLASVSHRERPEGGRRSRLNNIALYLSVVLIKIFLYLFWIATSPSALRNNGESAYFQLYKAPSHPRGLSRGAIATVRPITF